MFESLLEIQVCQGTRNGILYLCLILGILPIISESAECHQLRSSGTLTQCLACDRIYVIGDSSLEIQWWAGTTEASADTAGVGTWSLSSGLCRISARCRCRWRTMGCPAVRNVTGRSHGFCHQDGFRSRALEMVRLDTGNELIKRSFSHLGQASNDRYRSISDSWPIVFAKQAAALLQISADA
jgi:hypothetical protein